MSDIKIDLLNLNKKSQWLSLVQNKIKILKILSGIMTWKLNDSNWTWKKCYVSNQAKKTITLRLVFVTYICGVGYCSIGCDWMRLFYM